MKNLFTILSVLVLSGSSSVYATPHHHTSPSSPSSSSVSNTTSSSVSNSAGGAGGAGGRSKSVVNVSTPVLVNTGNSGYNTFSGMEWNNDNGFGNGVYCRTPSVFVGGNVTPTNGEYGNTSGYLNQYQVSAGVMIPFGSKSLEDCKALAAEITKQKKIENELQTLRVCAEVMKLGVVPDVKKFPNLAICVNN